MAKEHVVNYRDENGKECLLDLNNGHVYDKAGNQYAKWSVKDDSKTQDNLAMLADYCSDYSRGEISRASRSRVGKSELMTALSASSAEGLTNLDLGVGDVHIPSALPNYASGYRNEAPMADMFAPPLLTAMQSDKFWQFDKLDAFQRALPQVGAPAGTVPEIPVRIANSTFSAVEYAIGGFVSTQVEAAQDAALRIRQATAKRVMNALIIEREIRVSTIATTSGSWDSSLVAAVAAKWNGGATSDPVADVHTRQEKSWGAVTGMIMNERVYHAFIRNAAVQKFFTYKSSAKAIPNAAEVSALLELPPIYVAKMRYATGTNTQDYIWPDSVVLVRQPDQVPPTTQDDVATAYTFRWNAVSKVGDGTASGGFYVREFFNQNRGSMGGSQIVVLMHDHEVMTSKFVGGLLTGAFA